RLEQAQGERTEPGADLEHGLTRLDTGAADDRADSVRVHDEVLAALLRGADARRLSELADIPGGQEHPGAVLLGAHAATVPGQRYTSWVVARTARQAVSRSVPVTSAI